MSMEDCCKEITSPLDALKDDLRSQVGRVNGAAIEFFPAERCGDGRVSAAGTQGVGGCRVAADTVLSRGNRNVTSAMGRTVSQGNQLRIRSSELLSHRFDPGADALVGIPSC